MRLKENKTMEKILNDYLEKIEATVYKGLQAV